MLAFRSSAGRNVAELSKPTPEAGSTRALTERRFAVKLAATEQLVRAEVRNDLSMLVNTVALESTVDLDDLPHVRDSILNYGVPDIVSRTLVDGDVERVGQELRAALRIFEPRLVADTIVVARDPAADAVALSLRFIVRGDLMCNPVNVPVEFLADVEFEGQKISIKRL
jgi:type VI secretion system protein ImpF